MLKTLTGLYMLVFQDLRFLTAIIDVHSNFAFSSQGLWPLLWYVLTPTSLIPSSLISLLATISTPELFSFAHD